MIHPRPPYSAVSILLLWVAVILACCSFEPAAAAGSFTGSSASGDSWLRVIAALRKHGASRALLGAKKVTPVDLDKLSTSAAQANAIILKKAMQQQSWRQASCPSWMQEYSKMHHSMLQNPNAAKYMVYVCDEHDPNMGNIFCGGAGDRIRAMLETVRMSQYSNR